MMCSFVLGHMPGSPRSQRLNHKQHTHRDADTNIQTHTHTHTHTFQLRAGRQYEGLETISCLSRSSGEASQSPQQLSARTLMQSFILFARLTLADIMPAPPKDHAYNRSVIKIARLGSK